MDLIFKKCTADDVDVLTETRIEVLRAANRLSDDVDMEEVRRQSYVYYQGALPDGSHAAYLVYDGGQFVGAGGVSFYQVMPTYDNPTGQKAYIMNMYTKPAYRRKGIARHTFGLLIEECRARGVDFITLEATEAGRPLYEACGFVKMEDEMQLPKE
jgi:GNAT superfamily N-acetyltransferase